jgi:hypothetical protein
MRLTEALAYLNAKPEEITFRSTSEENRSSGEVLIKGQMVTHINLTNNFDAKKLRSELKGYKN